MEGISFFEKSNEIDEATTVNCFEFKSVLPPPKNEHVNSFEESIYNLARKKELKRIKKFKRIKTVF